MNKEEDSIEKKNLEYYNKKATEYTKSTLYVDFTEIQEWFTSYLDKGSLILDFGCGSGRDSLAFLKMGYKVEPMDGSPIFCSIAENVTHLKIKNLRFTQLNERRKYDGVWACASLLHVPFKDLPSIFAKINLALKKSGIVYCSFKYGNFEGVRNGRYFTDLTEEKFDKLIYDEDLFDIIETKVTSDVRKGRESEKWLNVILKKVN